MSVFVGRQAELRLLRKRLDRVIASREGAAIAIRGRRQVGKSRLVQEFCDRADVPYFYFAATKGASPVESITAFLAELADSSLAAGQVGPPTGVTGGWSDAFRVLGARLPDTPAVVVLDELPWLAEQDEVFDGALQTAWDRLWSRRPVLLVLLGSDLHMMERLTSYDRPFYGRADNLVLEPLNPAETGRAVEPLIREALELAGQAGELPWPDTAAVGGWWNRQHDPEVDLVVADRSPVAVRIDFVGSIKWIGSAFDRHDLEALRHSANHVPGCEAGRSGLAVVSLSEADIDIDDADLVWGPEEIMDCWEAGGSCPRMPDTRHTRAWWSAWTGVPFGWC